MGAEVSRGRSQSMPVNPGSVTAAWPAMAEPIAVSGAAGGRFALLEAVLLAALAVTLAAALPEPVRHTLTPAAGKVRIGDGAAGDGRPDATIPT